MGSAAVVSTLLEHPSLQQLPTQDVLEAAWEAANIIAQVATAWVDPAHTEGAVASWRKERPELAGPGEPFTGPEKLKVVCRLLQAAVARSDTASVYQALRMTADVQDATQQDEHAPCAYHLLHTAFSQTMLKMQGCLEGELRSQQCLLQQLSVTVAAHLPGLSDSSPQAAREATEVLGSTATGSTDSSTGSPDSSSAD